MKNLAILTTIIACGMAMSLDANANAQAAARAARGGKKPPKVGAGAGVVGGAVSTLPALEAAVGSTAKGLMGIREAGEDSAAPIINPQDVVNGGIAVGPRGNNSCAGILHLSPTAQAAVLQAEMLGIGGSSCLSKFDAETGERGAAILGDGNQTMKALKIEDVNGDGQVTFADANAEQQEVIAQSIGDGTASRTNDTALNGLGRVLDTADNGCDLVSSQVAKAARRQLSKATN